MKTQQTVNKKPFNPGLCMLTTSRKIDCVRKLEENITLPAKSFFVKNERAIRMCYFIGKTIKYIVLPTPLDVAIFLEKHGVIRFYSHKDGEISMYTTEIITEVTSSSWDFVQHEKTVRLKWDDISFTRSAVQHFAAVNEFEILGGAMGFEKNKGFGRGGNRAA